MKKMLRFTTLFFALCLPLMGFAHAPEMIAATSSVGNTLAPMLKKVTPAIVNISVEKVTMTDLNKIIQTKDDTTQVPVKTYAVGSGVIFDAAKGLIVTNAHVIAGEKVIIVTLKDGERYHGKLIAKDDGYDIAILQIHAKDLTALPFSDSDNLKVGDFVTAIGSPYGLSQTVTSGVVSALNRTHPQIEGYQSFIQTDAPINPGNSGGALVNMAGQLVGINTAMVAPSDGNIGIGFSIPSNMVHAVIEQLLQYGKVERGMLGVIVQNITPELANALHLGKEKGALVSEVVPNTPAAAAGLEPQDIIIKVDGHNIHSADQLRNIMGLTRPKTPVHITFMRNNTVKTTIATVADPKTEKTKQTLYFSGMRLQELTEQENDGTEIRGVLITKVNDSSEGALAGLMPGDVITAINSKPVTSIQTLQQLVHNQTQPIVLSVNRRGENVFLVLNAQ